jgi:hypothetical protein
MQHPGVDLSHVMKVCPRFRIGLCVFHGPNLGDMAADPVLNAEYYMLRCFVIGMRLRSVDGSEMPKFLQQTIPSQV